MSKLRIDVDGISVESDGPDEALDAIQKDAAKVTVLLPEPSDAERDALARYLAECIARKAVRAALGDKKQGD